MSSYFWGRVKNGEFSPPARMATLDEIVWLEHPTDKDARKRLLDALKVAFEVGDLPLAPAPPLPDPPVCPPAGTPPRTRVLRSVSLSPGRDDWQL